MMIMLMLYIYECLANINLREHYFKFTKFNPGNDVLVIVDSSYFKVVTFNLNIFIKKQSYDI